jgi:hypothetical protein
MNVGNCAGVKNWYFSRANIIQILIQSLIQRKKIINGEINKETKAYPGSEGNIK